MPKDAARVLLIRADANSIHQRSKRGTCIIFGFFVIFVSIILYLCSYDYESLAVERRIQHFHRLIPGQHKLSESSLIVNGLSNQDQVQGDEFVKPELWNTPLDHDNGNYNSNHGSNRGAEFNPKRISKFDMSANDVIVFLHIQNSGGNFFGKHIVEDLLLDRPCNCKQSRKCSCPRPNGSDSSVWFFSRWTVGWKCGVHPDWSELTHCVDRSLDEIEGQAIKRRYFYMTLLRDPVTRFLSEFYRFKELGTSTATGRHFCGGKEVDMMPNCHFDGDSSQVTLEQFLNCDQNLAINRQTRMLSDLALLNCYQNFSATNQSKTKDLIMLSSAKSNLHKIAFFGLTELPRISQKLFEKTFDVQFLDGDHSFYRGHNVRRSKRSLLSDLSEVTIQKIKSKNHLDMEFYEYAKQLIFHRFEASEGKQSVNPVGGHEQQLELDGGLDWGEREDVTINSHN